MNREGTREALIVAVADYQDASFRRLRAPAADAKELAEVLGDPAIGGFQVEVLMNPDEGELRRRLARFFRAERRPEDLLLVHFSCHGIKDSSGELYLAAADTEKDLLDATGIQSSWLNQRLNRCRSKRIVVLLDCCYSGSFPFGSLARAGNDVDAPGHFEGRGRAVITASSSMEYAYEGDQLTTDEPKPSMFTDAVVQGLRTGEADRDHDKRVSIQDLYDYVFERVRDTMPEQTPTMMSTLEGPLYIARSTYEPPIEPAELDEQLIGLAEHPVAEARLGAVDVLTRLLSSPDQGAALAARQMLERMVNDDSRRVAERAAAVLSRLSVGRETGPLEGEEPPGEPREHDQAREGTVALGLGMPAEDDSTSDATVVAEHDLAPPAVYAAESETKVETTGAATPGSAARDKATARELDRVREPSKARGRIGTDDTQASGWRRPRLSGRLAATLALAAMMAAVIGFIVAPGSSTKPPPTQPLVRSATARPLEVSFPASWEQVRTASAAQSIGLANAIALAPTSRRGGTLVIGTATTVDPTLLPNRLLKALPAKPMPQTISLGPSQFYRYPGISLGNGRAANIYTLPTTAGTVVGVCALQDARAGFPEDCERVISSLRLSSGKILGLGPSATLAAGLRRAIDKLNSATARGARHLRSAHNQRDQARAASELATAFRTAASDVQHIQPHPAAAGATTALASALQSAGADYGALARAAADNEGSSYRSARKRIADDATAISASLARLGNLGYVTS